MRVRTENKKNLSKRTKIPFLKIFLQSRCLRASAWRAKAPQPRCCTPGFGALGCAWRVLTGVLVERTQWVLVIWRLWANSLRKPAGNGNQRVSPWRCRVSALSPRLRRKKRTESWARTAPWTGWWRRFTLFQATNLSKSPLEPR